MLRLVRWVIMIAGLLYIWALLPVSIRPHYTGSPFRKPDATMNIDVGPVTTGVTAPQAIAGAVARNTPSPSRLKAVCEPPALLEPVVRPAESVLVKYVGRGKVVAQTRYDCNQYV